MPNKINIKKIRNSPAQLKIVELQFDFPRDQEERLGLLSISVNPEKLNFSFFQKDDNLEGLRNPNIKITKKENLVLNKRSGLENKFDNTNDPIFDLDDARSKVDSKNKLKDNAKASVVLSRISVKNTKTKYGVKNGS
tara:strand:+ start:4156 stop:4566 length:411 start_codon:yes stop_codon:yes gene_type:complete